MINVYEDRDFIEEMFEVSTEYWIKFVKAIVTEGLDFLWPGDDIAFKTGLFIPPKLSRKFGKRDTVVSLSQQQMLISQSFSIQMAGSTIW